MDLGVGSDARHALDGPEAVRDARLGMDSGFDSGPAISVDARQEPDGGTALTDAALAPDLPVDAVLPDARPDLYFDPASLVQPCVRRDPPDVVDPMFEAEFRLTAVAPGYLRAVADLDGNGAFEVGAFVSEGRGVPPDRQRLVGYSFVGGVVSSAWDVENFKPFDSSDMDGDGVGEVLGLTWIPEPPEGDPRSLQPALQLRRLDHGLSLGEASVLATVGMFEPVGAPVEDNWFFQAEFWDFDGDGRAEIFDGLPAEIRELANGTLMRIAVDDNPADPGFLGNLEGTLAVDDFDGDGLADVVSSEVIPPAYGGPMAVARVVEVEGDMQFHLRFHEPMPSMNQDLVATGDFAGTGHRGFLCGGESLGGCFHFGAYRATANDAYERYWSRSLILPSPFAQANADSGDTDLDGRDEFLINTGSGLWLYESDGADGFRLIYTLTYADCWLGCYGTAALEDVTGDGRADLIVGRGPASDNGRIPANGIQIYERAR